MKPDSAAAATDSQKTPPGEIKKTDTVRAPVPVKRKAPTIKPQKPLKSKASSEELLADALERVRNKDWAGAAAALQGYVTLRPTDYEARYYLARSLSEIDSTSGAEREFRESIRIRPDYEPSLRELGVRLVHQQRTTEALTLLEKARQLDPANYRTYTHLGIGYVDKNQPAEAERYFRKALQLNDDDTEAKEHFGALLYRKADQYGRKDSVGKALTTAEEALDLVEPDAQQRLVLAGAYAAYGYKLEEARNYQDAKLYYQKALVVEPYNPLAYSGLLGILHDVEFDFGGAFRHALKWMKRFPKDTSRMTEMIEALVTVGASADAGETFDTIREVGLKPDSRVVVDALELVSLAASGEEALLKQRKSQLKNFVSAQASNLDYHWRFTGTLHYVAGLNPRNRDWLARLLTAIQNNDQAKILAALG